MIKNRNTSSRPLRQATGQPRKPRLIVPPKRASTAARRVTPDDGTYVTVACKHPSGIRLRVFEMIDVRENGPSGGRMTKMAQQIGGPDNVVEIRGYGRDREFTMGGIVNAGFALTRNVPKAFFDLWLKQNADSDLVLNGLIFAHREERSVKHQIIDHDSQWCGLEPIQPTPPSGGSWEKPPVATDPRLKSIGKLAPTTLDRND